MESTNLAERYIEWLTESRKLKANTYRIMRSSNRWSKEVRRVVLSDLRARRGFVPQKSREVGGCLNLGGFHCYPRVSSRDLALMALANARYSREKSPTWFVPVQQAKVEVSCARARFAAMVQMQAAKMLKSQGK